MYGTARPEVNVTPLAADKLDLTGKRVHIIGGTSGIGRALALSCAAKGAAVTVVGRSVKARAPTEPGSMKHSWRLRPHLVCSARAAATCGALRASRDLLSTGTRLARPCAASARHLGMRTRLQLFLHSTADPLAYAAHAALHG